MTGKLPRKLIDELDGLAQKLITAAPEERNRILTHLQRYEESGLVPLPVLIQMSEEDLNAVSVYAIGALGRNRQPAAVDQLLRLLQRHRNESAMLLETLVEALGETGAPQTALPLLELLGIRPGWRGVLERLIPAMRKKEDTKALATREYLVLPVVRALAKINNPQSTARLGEFLGHKDPLVRWHTIQAMSNTGRLEFIENFRVLAAQDPDSIVREMAAIALDRLLPPPPVSAK
ncbi:MAG: HEAT repeat domain-containing protein [Deltaproteobacteria bacterium]|nr:HEAT repeat domain-containing protein [Deltaproteobacteria bacterium]